MEFICVNLLPVVNRFKLYMFRRKLNGKVFVCCWALIHSFYKLMKLIVCSQVDMMHAHCPIRNDTLCSRILWS